MDIGLYQIKYPARKLLMWIYPLFGWMHPNLLSALVIPASALAAYCLYMGLSSGSHAFYLASMGAVLLRMFFGTVDGLVAQTKGLSSQSGELINRLAPELGDLMLLGTLCYFVHDMLMVITVLSVAWLTSFLGLFGLLIKGPVQSVGPVGQTDRLFAYLLFLGAGLYLGQVGYYLHYFLLWCIIGGTLTCLLRIRRAFAECH